MSSASQKALLIPSKGAKFEVGTRTIPKPGPGQVLVKLYAAALNPVDNYVQQFGVFVESYPAVAGSDGAGTIEELGEGATGFAKGDKVFFQGIWVADRGTFQQYALADAVRVAKIPTKYSFDDVATVPLGFATAAIGLYAKKAARGGAELATPWSAAGRDKYKGQPAIVIGGSSSVGQFALQLLKLSGFGPIITTASTSNAEYAKAAGATDVIDYHTTPYAELPAAVAKITSTPVPVIYDAIGSPESQKASWEILAPKGSLVVTLQPVVGKPGEEAEDGKRLVHVFGSSNSPENREIGNDIYAHLTGLLETGAVKPNKVEILPDGLAGIPAGVARLGQKAVSGVKSGVKLVARPQETA